MTFKLKPGEQWDTGDIDKISGHKFEPDKDCDQNGNTNEVRAQRGIAALTAYAKLAGYRQKDGWDPSHLQDMICDLAHAADREGLEMAEAIDSGLRCYLDER